MEWGWFTKLDMVADNVLGMNCMYSRLYYTHCVTACTADCTIHIV